MKNGQKLKQNSSNKKQFIYGKHATFAALNNPLRVVLNIFCLKKYYEEVKTSSCKNINIVESKYLATLVGSDAIHQGIVVEVLPLKTKSFKDITQNGKVILILDQVTDPHNVGAIVRSAAAFDVGAVIVSKDNSADESAIMAKSACGALEIIPIIKEVNISRVIDNLKSEGYWCVGLDGASKQPFHKLNNFDKTAIILGSEGAGIRNLVKKKCDVLARLPISSKIESLNVSNAATIALYELSLNR